MKAGLFAALSISACLFAQNTGTVEGHVINSATGLAIPGVEVRIQSGQSASYETATDESGAFRITGVNFGRYGSAVTKKGYVRVLERLFEFLPVLGTDPVRCDIQMAPWTTLRGHVLDPDGKPAGRVRVQLGPARFAEEVTDENGSFAFENLSPRAYTLRAIPEPKIQIKDGARIDAVPTYFSSALEMSQAEKIFVRGVDLPDYEIRLRTSLVYRVRCTVLDETGTPAPHAKVKLLRLGAQRTQEVGLVTGGPVLDIATGTARASEQEAEVVSGPDGAFEFPSVRPGECRIQAEFDPTLDKVERSVEPSGGDSVIVNGRDIDGLEIRLAAPFRLDYSLDWGEAKPSPEATRMARVWLSPLDGQPGPDIRGEPALMRFWSPAVIKWCLRLFPYRALRLP